MLKVYCTKIDPLLGSGIGKQVIGRWYLTDYSVKVLEDVDYPNFEIPRDFDNEVTNIVLLGQRYGSDIYYVNDSVAITLEESVLLYNNIILNDMEPEIYTMYGFLEYYWDQGIRKGGKIKNKIAKFIVSLQIRDKLAALKISLNRYRGPVDCYIKHKVVSVNGEIKFEVLITALSKHGQDGCLSAADSTTISDGVKLTLIALKADDDVSGCVKVDNGGDWYAEVRWTYPEYSMREIERIPCSDFEKVVKIGS